MTRSSGFRRLQPPCPGRDARPGRDDAAGRTPTPGSRPVQPAVPAVGPPGAGPRAAPGDAGNGRRAAAAAGRLHDAAGAAAATGTELRGHLSVRITRVHVSCCVHFHSRLEQIRVCVIEHRKGVNKMCNSRILRRLRLNAPESVLCTKMLQSLFVSCDMLRKSFVRMINVGRRCEQDNLAGRSTTCFQNDFRVHSLSVPRSPTTQIVGGRTWQGAFVCASVSSFVPLPPLMRTPRLKSQHPPPSQVCFLLRA